MVSVYTITTTEIILKALALKLIFPTLLPASSLVPKCANVPQCDAEVLD